MSNAPLKVSWNEAAKCTVKDRQFFMLNSFVISDKSKNNETDAFDIKGVIY